MSTTTILVHSARALARRWPVVLSLYGITLFIVLPVVLAFRSTLAFAFDLSPVAERMFGGFDHTTYDDFMLAHRGAVQFLQRTVGPIALISIVVHGLSGAGVVAAMAGQGTAAEFFGAVGRFVGRSARLLVYAIAMTTIVLLIWSFGVVAVWGAMTSGHAVESDLLTAAIVSAALMLAPVAVLSLSTEYARVLIVREDRREVLRSLFEGVRFVFQHPLRMLLQHGSIVTLMLGLVVLYWLVDAEIGMTTPLGIMAMLVIQQASVLARIGIRVWHTTSALMLVDALTPEVPEAAASRPTATLAKVVPTHELIQSAPLPVEAPAKKPIRKRAQPVRRAPVRRPRKR